MNEVMKRGAMWGAVFGNGDCIVFLKENNMENIKFVGYTFVHFSSYFRFLSSSNHVFLKSRNFNFFFPKLQNRQAAYVEVVG